MAVQNNELKIVVNLNKVVTASETTSGTTAGKVKLFHCHLQISNVSVHVYSVYLLPQAKVLPMKFCEQPFKLTAKTTKITTLKICMYTVAVC